MRILNILKKVGVIGGKTVVDVAAASNPILGTLIEVATNAILHAEAKHGAGNGEVKHDAAMSIINVAAPALLKLAEMAAQRDIADDAQFAEGVSDLVSALVKILNSFRFLPKQ